MPRARPEATTSPDCPNSAAISRANRLPAADAFRAPMIAMAGPDNFAGSPNTVRTGGGSWIAASASGYSGSHKAMIRAPRLIAAAISSSASVSEIMDIARLRPPRRESSGAISIAPEISPACCSKA